MFDIIQILADLRQAMNMLCIAVVAYLIETRCITLNQNTNTLVCIFHGGVGWARDGRVSVEGLL